MGPTASGKTALSLSLANHLPIEIINVDSAQIYQGMDIGTAKPSPAEQAQVPHHLIDILKPDVRYSCAQFCEDALKMIAEIQNRNRIPVLVGGTMLYFKALQEGLSPLPEADKRIRAQLDAQLKQEGLSALYHCLNQVDPISASKIKPTDSQRIQRALEVFLITNKPLSSFHNQSALNQDQAIRFINIALMPIETPRALLHERIETRFQEMIEEGFIDEVQNLLTIAEDDTLPARRCVGYRQVAEFLNKKISLEDMKFKGVAATRQLAKRQMTWLRHWQNCHQFDFLHVNPNLILNLLSA